MFIIDLQGSFDQLDYITDRKWIRFIDCVIYWTFKYFNFEIGLDFNAHLISFEIWGLLMVMYMDQFF